MKTAGDRYEKAFESWLNENRVQFVSVNQKKRKTFSRNKIKSFDYILYRRSGGPVIAEVKGRKFEGTSLESMAGLQCWVTQEDMRGLGEWEKVFAADGDNISGVFVFAYEFTNIDVETDGREVYDFDGRQYMFLSVGLDDYRRYMKKRSGKWKTLFIGAGHFRQCAVGIRHLLF